MDRRPHESRILRLLLAGEAFAFQIDQQPAFWIAQAYIWHAALPSFLVQIFLELIPLQDPSLGWKLNTSFYVRLFVRIVFGTTATNIQMQEFIPQLRLSQFQTGLLSCLQSLPYAGTLLVAAQALSIFPVPFSSLMAVPATVIVTIVLHYAFVRGVLERDPALKIQFQCYERLIMFAFSLIIVYCVYGFVLRQVESHFQLVLSFALFGIKQWAKNLMWRLSHIQEHHDLSAESVSCGVHLFHALFAIICLQTAHSYVAFMVVLGMGMAQDLLALRYLRQISIDVSTMLQELTQDGLVSEANSPYHAHWTARLISVAQPMPAVTRLKIFDGVPVMVVRGAYFRHQQTAVTSLYSESVSPVIPLLPKTSGAVQSEEVRKARATQAVAHLLHCREVVLLRMFVDIFVPLSYLAYCTAMLLLLNNNRHYNESLRDMNWSSLSTLHVKVSIIAVTKIIVLFILCGFFQSNGQPSGVHQLVFVIRSQRRTMQTWFFMNFIQLIDFSLAHMGNDLSFQFAWLHNKD